MFTRCPHCTRIFEVSTEQLSLAEGDVRCGNCAQLFNAGEYICEAPEDKSGDDPGHQGQQAPAEHDDDNDEALEFDAPEQTWSTFFIDAQPAPLQGGDVSLEGDLDAITADPDEWQSMLSEIDPPLPWQRAPGDPASENPDDDEDTAEIPIVGEDEDRAVPPAAKPGIEPSGALPVDDDEQEPRPAAPAAQPVAEEAPPRAVATDWSHESLAAEPAAAPAEYVDDAPEPDIDEFSPAWATRRSGERRGAAAWLAASVLLLLTAAAQFVHMNRDELAANPDYGERIRGIYEWLDQPLLPDWPLEAYSVRRAEAIAGGSAPDALDISAAVEITGDRPVGLPLIRVSLRDQWANTVASGIFRPAEYLASDLPDIVPAGTRIPVRLSVLDPGIQARGYELDVCLPDRVAGLQCQLAREPFVR